MCDCLVALAPATQAAHALFAKNSDRPPDEAQRLERFPARLDVGTLRTTHITIDASTDDTVGFIGSRPWWAWGVEHGVNDAGVAIGNETIYTTVDPRGAPPGLPGIDLVRLGLERSTSAGDAVEVITELVERHGQGGSGHVGRPRPYWSSFLIADPTTAFVVETSDRTVAVEQVGEVRAISNRTTIPAFDAVHRHPRQPVETLVDPRWKASRKVLAGRAVTERALRDHLRSHVGGSDGWTVCMHVDGVEATTAAVVADLTTGTASFLLGSPCRSVFVPLFVRRALGPVVPWERLIRLKNEHRDTLDELEAELHRDVVDDDDWAAHAWGRVDTVLTSLGVDQPE